LRIPAAPALAFFIFASQQATPAEFAHLPNAKGPDVVLITGTINIADSDKFNNIASPRNKAVVVLLDSRGGFIGEAIKIGQLIRHRGWETAVQKYGLCNSACTLIWISGAVRHLDNPARLGFHSARKSLESPERNEASNIMMGRYLTNMGAPPELVELAPKADPCCFNYVTPAMAKAWGLLEPAQTHQAAAPEATQQEAKKGPIPLSCFATLCATDTPKTVPTVTIEPKTKPAKPQPKVESLTENLWPRMLHNPEMLHRGTW
jgi:hypothetical protein